MAQNEVGGHEAGFMATRRIDTWWLGPVVVVVVFSAWLIYYAWAALTPHDFVTGPYLSPFYSPLLFEPPHAVEALAASSHHGLLGDWPAWWPALLPASPALFIALFPGLFRFTCYYYRKAYYRAFVGMPPACGVNAVPVRKYRGETGILIFQNLHRYALYFAILLLPFLYYDALMSFTHDGQLGIGVGSVIILLNAIFLTGYTFGCHAWRHLIGGRLDCFSCGSGGRTRFQLWKASTWFNGRHMEWAWVSLLWIAFADMYVRLVANGTIHDLNTWGF